jgi:2'-5' RNA ligase
VILIENSSMEEPRGKGISLWLMPEGSACDRLVGLIGRLAARLGTTAFAPHVTLLPGVSGAEDDVLDRARALAADLEPLSLELSGIDGSDAHFRCLFHRVADVRPMQAAHERASSRFGRELDTSFDPHLSLVYGTLAPELKNELARELSAEAPIAFEASRVHVWRTEGVVGEWRELATFGLGPGDGAR